MIMACMYGSSLESPPDPVESPIEWREWFNGLSEEDQLEWARQQGKQIPEEFDDFVEMRKYLSIARGTAQDYLAEAGVAVPRGELIPESGYGLWSIQQDMKRAGIPPWMMWAGVGLVAFALLK